jgi:hypothetical protein
MEHGCKQFVNLARSIGKAGEGAGLPEGKQAHSWLGEVPRDWLRSEAKAKIFGWIRAYTWPGCRYFPRKKS